MNKFIITICIIFVVAVGGFFIYKSVNKDNVALESSSPTPTQSPEATPTPTPTPTFTMIPDTVKTVTATITTAKGNIVLELYPKVAPKTVANFVTLASAGFYDGTKFHRVVADFVIQGGDPLSKTDDPSVGTGGPGYKFEDEINPKILGLTDVQIANLESQDYQYSSTLESMPVKVGVIAMANSGPNTNGSQFFIVTTKDQPSLNGKHTVFGKVTKGMDIVKKIAQGDIVTKITISNIK
jgi:peptidyl-prolyl cis-trans isomerase B (cyclophilin B)